MDEESKTDILLNREAGNILYVEDNKMNQTVVKLLFISNGVAELLLAINPHTGAWTEFFDDAGYGGVRFDGLREATTPDISLQVN